MGLFSRRAAPADTNITTAPGTVPSARNRPAYDDPHLPVNPSTTRPVDKDVERQSGGRHHSTHPNTLSSRPTFGEWLKGTWLDILTMAILGALGLGVSDIIHCYEM
jgi:hypothetical protein